MQLLKSSFLWYDVICYHLMFYVCRFNKKNPNEYLEEKITSGDYVLGSVDVLMVIINGLHVYNFFIFMLLIENYVPKMIFVLCLVIVFAYYFTSNLRTFRDSKFIFRMNTIFKLYQDKERNIERDLILVLLYIVFPIFGIFVQRVLIIGQCYQLSDFMKI